ncbi:unnamed protein product [Rotaria magnacalcarata]|uniref:B30.2/SPRY domain-containing protein n=2 Tax=Rotaria magnacalcarata TaxID=392030 RepID=A0A816MJN4_9BILA|nr:unnamed protein product [Rotaria magnacalcarata]CAF2073208.1 unnamed protein product [Rotaria magnacalcarata]
MCDSVDIEPHRDSFPLPHSLKYKHDLKIENDLVFDATNCGPGFSLTEHNTNVRKTSSNGVWYPCLIGNAGWSRGAHYWSVRIHDRGPSGHVQVGIVNGNTDMSANTDLATGSNGYGYYVVNGNKLAFASQIGFSQTIPRNGDVIGILLDLEELTLTYFHNGHNLGTAFGKIPINQDAIKYYPAIACYEIGCSVSMIKTIT